MENNEMPRNSTEIRADAGFQNSTNWNQNSGIDYNHPLFLSPSDVSGIQIIAFQLTGVENFSIWFRSMRIALLGRNKLGLVDGTCNKDQYPETMWNHWERVNAIVLSWLMNSISKNLLGGVMYASVAQRVWEDLLERFNKIDGSRTYNLHKEIATLTQGTSSVSSYFSKLKNLWEEFEALVPSPGCDCEKSKSFVVHLQKLKLFQFLMGLNDSYSQARGQILMMNPLPTINQAYALVVSDEGQKSVASTAGVFGTNLNSGIGNIELAMYSKTNYNHNNNAQRFKKNFNVVCDFCKWKGHVKETCYKLVGYPADFKSKRKVQSNGNLNGAAYNVLCDSRYEKCASENDRTESYNSGATGYGQGSITTENAQKMNNGASNEGLRNQDILQMTQMGGNYFSKEQYDQIVKLIKQGNPTTSTSSVSANTAGMTAP